MIKPELYNRTVGILYDAYFNDTLVHGDCKACAVGNLVAKSCGYRIAKMLNGKLMWLGATGEKINSEWGNVFRTPGKRLFKKQEQLIDIDEYRHEAKNQIISTGYAVDELARIEFAFESAKKGRSAEDYMFNGLVAVLEVLKEIHQVADEDLLQVNNKRFKDHYDRRVGATVESLFMDKV